MATAYDRPERRTTDKALHAMRIEVADLAGRLGAVESTVAVLPAMKDDLSTVLLLLRGEDPLKLASPARPREPGLVERLGDLETRHRDEDAQKTVKDQNDSRRRGYVAQLADKYLGGLGLWVIRLVLGVLLLKELGVPVPTITQLVGMGS